MSVQKISSFKSFTEVKNQTKAAQLHEEGKAKRAEIVSKIGAALEEMGVTSLQELDEEKRNALVAKIFNEDEAEEIEKDIVKLGEPKKEDPKKGEELTNESVINEGTRSQIGKIDKSGKIVSTYVHYDGYPENMVPLLKNYKDSKSVDQLLKLGKAGISYLDAKIGDKPLDFNNPEKGITLFYGRDRNEKGDMTTKADVKNVAKYLKGVANQSGAEYAYLYDERDGKWYMADTYEDKELKPVAESLLTEGNAFGAAVTKAKEDGKEEFEFDGKTYKVKEDNASEFDVIDDVFEANYNVSRSAISRMGGLVLIKEMNSLLDCAKPVIEDLYEEGFELDEIIGYIAYRINDKFEGIYESEVNEGSHGMATKLLQGIVDGDSSSAEGIKMSKELAQHFIDWIRTSPYGKKNGNLPLEMLVKASFNWGIERSLDSKLKAELKSLKDSVNESIENDDVNEARSINKIQSEWTKVTNAMKDTAASWKAAEGDAKTALLNTLKEMTAKKKALEAELDAVVSDKDKDLELAMESMILTLYPVNEGFEVHYSDGVRAMKKFGNEKQAIDFAKDLIKNKKSLQFVDVFNAGSGFHSTSDTNAIVAFWGDGSYTDNVSKKDDKLAAKKIQEAVEFNEEDIKSDDQFKEYAMTVLKDAFKDDFDEAKANDVIKGILAKVDGDYGAAIGMLTSSLGESVTNEATNITKILRKLGWSGETWTPQELASQIKNLDDSTLITWSKDSKGIPNTPLAFQMKLVDAEMEKRGLSESVVAEATKITMNNLDWGKSTAERNDNLDKYNSLKTDKEKEAFLSKLKAESVTNEATVEVDAVDPKDKNLGKLLKKHNVSMEVINKKGPSGFPEVKLTGDVKDLKVVLADDEYGWDDEDLADYIEESLN